jgi:hypothetical protein
MPGRFVELAARQIDLFASEHDDLLRDCQDALDAYNGAPREDAEELYGDYVDRVDLARDALLEYRDGYAQTLDAEAAEEYEAVFNDLVRKRIPTLALEID